MNAAQPPRQTGGKGWLHGCLIAAVATPLLLALLIVLFYAEENWRGAHAWQQTKVDLQAQGESFDPAKFIPALVPAAENFGALPFFDEVPDPDSPSSNTKRLALTVAVKNVTDHMPPKADSAQPDDLPSLGNWQKGETPEAVVVQKKLLAFLQHEKPVAVIPAGATPADLFTQICPVLHELRTANATHPQCRFERNSDAHPWDMGFGPITAQIKVSQLFVYDERLALMSHRPDLALEDFRVIWKIDAGLRKEPAIVTGLVSAAIVAIQLNVINQGLAAHAWSDPELAALDDDLGKIDFLAESQFCIRGEVARFTLPLIDYYASHRFKWQSDTLEEGAILGRPSSWSDEALQLTYALIPQGWFDRYKADGAGQLLGGVQMTDPVSRRVYPERGDHLFPVSDEAGSRWINFVTETSRPALASVKNFAYQQVQVDEARISCRLERYRLAHGAYPATLDALVPTYGTDLPRDIMNGGAYHYQLSADGKYLLYSVGWNQKDDQGHAGPFRNKDSQDWIWTNYPNWK
jgi:hypothetical protein